MRKTKIVCTLGPASSDPSVMKELIKKGMDVARFNFSHGTYEEQKGKLDTLKELREQLDIPVAALLDTKGPEIRTGTLKDGKPVELVEGQTFTLSTKEREGGADGCFINYDGLIGDVEPGNTILIDDGLIELKVKSLTDTDIVCTVVSGGELGEQKGINVPNVKVRLPALTDKDRADIRFGIKQGFDFVAASFVRNADCINEIREILWEENSPMQIIAKIENAEGLENLDEIVAAADGVMVARGDLGVEIPEERIPHIQKIIIDKCNRACKPVITATQMLDSMIHHPRPTRAEVTDVANAVYDGTDAVMLSGETASGAYPVEALEMMVKICRETEKYLDYGAYRTRTVDTQNTYDITNAVCYSSVSTAASLKCKYILAPSISGFTTRQLSKWRAKADIIGLSPSAATVRQMQLYWGVRSFCAPRSESTDELIDSSVELLKEKGMVKSGDIVVVTAGLVTKSNRHKPAANTNIMRVVEVE